MTHPFDRSSRNHRARLAPAIEPLELRVLLTAVVVNTIADSTDAPPSTVISLRDAINIANKSATATTITFSPTVFATAKTITLGGTDLLVSGAKPVTITGPAAGVTVNGDDKTNEFHVDAGSTLTLSGMTVTGGNSTELGGNGGGIENDGTLTLSKVIVSNNASSDAFGPGGGIDNDGTATLTDCTVTGNSTPFYGDGGGINNDGTLTLTGCTISDNAAGASDVGGGICSGGGNITVTDCTISGNMAGNNGGGGGGLEISSAATLVNCTIANNSEPTAQDPGGGICVYAAPGTVVTITGCTIADNTAGGAGGLLNYILPDSQGGPNYVGATVIVANTIVAGNSAPMDPDTEGPFQSLGHNLIGNVGDSTGWTSTDLTGTAANPLSADLGALANNGGPTLTMLPLAASPAIANGSIALIPKGDSTDQRGLPRIVNGAVDIGVVEVQKDPTTIHASDLGGTFNGKPFPATGYVAGIHGAAIATPVFTYYLASDKTLSDPLPGAPINAGSYVFVAKYVGTSTYLSAETSAPFTIARAPATIHAADRGGVYDGKPYPATGYVAGIGGASIAAPVFTYYVATDTTFSDPLTGPPSAAGNYVFMATFAGNNNYLPTSTTAPFTISAAPV